MQTLLNLDPTLTLSTSVTTRPQRDGETDDVDYHFTDDGGFDGLISDDAFLEWAEVFGRRYGTLRSEVDAATGGGRDVLLEIDVQGARSIRERVPEAVLIFLAPPSREELERRLRERGTESDEAIAARLQRVGEEMAEQGRFDHVVVNDDLGSAASQVAAIIQGYR